MNYQAKLPLKLKTTLVGPVLHSSKELKRKLALVFHDRDDEILIAVDGGLDHCLQAKMGPDLAIGDWDSLKPSSKSKLKYIRNISLPQRKGVSDLFFAASTAALAGAKEINAIGFSGLRPDHHLAVLYDLSWISSGAFGEVESVRLLGTEADYYFLSPKIGKLKLNVAKKKTIISILPIGGIASGVTLKGFRYALDGGTLTVSSQGLSNLAIRSTIEVELKHGFLVVILPHGHEHESKV